MTFTNNKLREAIRFALVAGATGLMAAPTAFAQSETATLDRIEVTGSRIKRVDTETSQPVFTVDREAIKAQGLTSVGDVIQNLTANGSTLNTTQNNGGNGETRVSLRNLGSNRTLVLVNGRRWIGGTGLGGAVDLNTIPTAAVERIEVLKDGASVIYGSDAIAGVVNVILRSDFDGAEMNGYIGQFDKGDGERYSADFTVGTVGERHSTMMGVGYVNEKPVMAGDRTISSVPVFGASPGFGGSSTTPNGRFRIAGTSQFFTNDGPGTAFRPYVTADNYNFAPDNYLLTPQERVSFFAKGHIDITDNVRFVAQTTYNNRKSEQLLAAMPVTLGLSTSSPLARAVRISANSIYNPTGQEIDWIQRRVNETGGRSFNQNIETIGFNGYFEGMFEIGDRFFAWDAGYFHGENRASNITYGLFNVSALGNALGPSEIRNGTPVCVTAPGGSVITGCVPLNFMGGLGTITQQMLDYVTFTAKDNLAYEMKNYFANISGDVFELPAGMVQFAAGYEKRFEEGFDEPDALIATGNTTGNARTPTGGGYNLQEFYLEFQVPLLADKPLAESLEMSIAARYSDYSNFGDTTNSKIGLKWKPFSDLLVRANYSEGFRAPSILELFRGNADSFPQISDPCRGTLQGVPNTERPACTGIPAYDQANPQIRITVGGNPLLQPEVSETKTLGFVYSPNYVDGLDVSLDWWNITIDNAIATLGGQTIMDLCHRGGVQSACGLISRDSTGQVTDLRSVPANVAFIEAEGYDLTVNYRLPEFSWGRVSLSWDSTYLANYNIDRDADGHISADPVTGDGGNRAGKYFDRDNYWRIRSNLLARWELGDWGATASMRYYSSQVESCSAVAAAERPALCSEPVRFTDLTEPGRPAGSPPVANGPDSRPINKIGSVTYTDVSAYWNAPWNGRVTVGVNNIFDRDPPRSVVTFANSFDPQYEVPGRYYYMQYSQRF